jgi:hypothetical protein
MPASRRLEVRPEATPAELVFGVLWGVEIEDATTSATDARQLGTGGVSRDVV